MLTLQSSIAVRTSIVRAPRPMIGHTASQTTPIVRRYIAGKASEKEMDLSATDQESFLSKMTAFLTQSPANAIKKQLANLQAGSYDQDAVKAEVQQAIDDNKVVVFSWSFCPFCVRAKELLDEVGAVYTAIELDQMEGSDGSTNVLFTPGYKGNAYRAELAKMTDRTSMPNIFINGVSVGGCNDGPGITTLQGQGKLVPMLQEAGALKGA